MEYSDKIMKIRETFYLSQYQFAELLNVNINDVKDWENNIEKPKKEDLININKIFGITKDMLFNKKNNCSVNTMKIKLNKQFQLFDLINKYYINYDVCPLKKYRSLFIIGPILNILDTLISLLYYLSNPTYLIGTVLDNIEEKSRKKTHYLDYLLESDNSNLLITYKKGYAYITPITINVKKKKFKYNGFKYKRINK